MARLAQFLPAFDADDRAQLVAAWKSDVIECPTVVASRVHVINLQTGEVLYTKGLTTGETRPASMTKLMTALLLVERYPTKVELVAKSVTMIFEPISEGTSATFNVGDVTNLYDLLAMAQLPSDNAAAAMIGYVLGAEALGGSPTYAQAKARFVTMMNARATELGMTQTTYINAHGLDNNASSPRDTNLLLAALVKNPVLRNIWRFSSWAFTVTRSGVVTILQSPAAYGNGYPGMVGGKGGSLTGLFNRAVLWEAPNGHMIAMTTMGSTTSAELASDIATIIAHLPVDYPALAAPSVPFTPAYVFDVLGLKGVWFDGSVSSTMFQDAAGTVPVAAANQVGKWVPKAGNLSVAWSQGTADCRPQFDGTKLVFDGTNDYLDLGASSFGSASLFADSNQKWMVIQRFTSTGTTGTVMAKAGASNYSRTFHSYVDSTVGAEPGLWLRGTQSYADNNLADGSAHTMNVFWDGEYGGMGRIDQGAKRAVVGEAAEEAQNITLGARTGGAASFLKGSVEHIVLVADYDIDTYRRLRDWANGAVINAFGYSAGLIDETQLLGPVDDVSKGAWSAASGSDLYAMLDEATADDSDFIVATTPTSCELALAVGGTPQTNGAYVFSYRLLDGSGNLTVILKQGSSTIASWGPHPLTSAPQTFNQTLTAGQIAALTDYSDLRVAFEAQA